MVVAAVVVVVVAAVVVQTYAVTNLVFGMSTAQLHL